MATSKKCCRSTPTRHPTPARAAAPKKRWVANSRSQPFTSKAEVGTRICTLRRRQPQILPARGQTQRTRRRSRRTQRPRPKARARQRRPLRLRHRHRRLRPRLLLRRRPSLRRPEGKSSHLRRLRRCCSGPGHEQVDDRGRGARLAPIGKARVRTGMSIIDGCDLRTGVSNAARRDASAARAIDLCIRGP